MFFVSTKYLVTKFVKVAVVDFYLKTFNFNFIKLIFNKIN